MERPEAQDTGSIILTGFDSNIVLESVRLSILHHNHNEGSIQIPEDYKITKGQRLVQITGWNSNPVKFKFTDTLVKTERDIGGFGSTGK